MFGKALEHAARDSLAIDAAVSKCQPRLQRGNIRRMRHDQVECLSGEWRVQITLDGDEIRDVVQGRIEPRAPCRATGDVAHRRLPGEPLRANERGNTTSTAQLEKAVAPLAWHQPKKCVRL